MSNQNNSMKISVVMPCLNEAETLERCIKKAFQCFGENNLNGEVIVSDNGSEDGSQEIARRNGARVVHQHIKGYGAALRKGFEEARGEYIVMGDSDDSYSFLDVHRFVRKLDEGYDLVMGSRLKGEIKKDAMPWHHRYFGNPVLTFILNLLYQVGISDAHCGMRGFRKDVVPRMDLRTYGMEFASEMVIKSARARMRISEIPVTLSPDGRSRPPHLRSFRDGWRHLRLMLMLAPKALFIWPGSIICLASLAFQVLILANNQISIGQVVLRENTMILCMMGAVIGFQMLYLGLFAYLFTSSRLMISQNRQIQFILRYSKFEWGIVVGTLLLIAGFFGDALVLKSWAGVGFGELGAASLRQSIFFSTVLILGIQMIISSFFLNMIGVDRAIYAGDLNLHEPK